MRLKFPLQSHSGAQKATSSLVFSEYVLLPVQRLPVVIGRVWLMSFASLTFFWVDRHGTRRSWGEAEHERLAGEARVTRGGACVGVCERAALSITLI